MVKFTVSTDSTCDLYRQYVDENDVKFVSLTFTVEEKGTLTDGLDAFTSYQQYVDFYAKLRAAFRKRRCSIWKATTSIF